MKLCLVVSTVIAMSFTGPAHAAYLGTTYVTESPDPSVIPVGTTATITIECCGGNKFERVPAGIYEPSRGYYTGILYFDVLGLQYSSYMNVFVNCFNDDRCEYPYSTGGISNVIVAWKGPAPFAGFTFLEPIGPPQGYPIGWADPNSPALQAITTSPSIQIPFRNPETGEQAFLSAPAVAVFSQVPEPSSLALLAAGLAGLLGLARCRQRGACT